MASHITTAKRDARRREAFLEELAKCGSVTAAWIAAGGKETSRTVVYNWRRADPVFAAAWLEAEETGTDRLEDEARRRAVDGVSHQVGWHKGEAGGTEQQYSDTLLILLLKARRPEKYRDNVKHSGTIGVTTHEDALAQLAAEDAAAAALVYGLKKARK